MTITYSKTMAKIIALIIWVGGIISLSLKGIEHFTAAYHADMSTLIIIISVVFSIIAGLLKGHFLFRKNCRNNLNRIDNLIHPHFWQAFSTTFFLALIIMMSTGILLSHYAVGHPVFEMTVGILDWIISTSLAISSLEFYYNFKKQIK